MTEYLAPASVGLLVLFSIIQIVLGFTTPKSSSETQIIDESLDQRSKDETSSQAAEQVTHQSSSIEEKGPVAETPKEEKPGQVVPTPRVTWKERLGLGLERSRKGPWGKILSIFQKPLAEEDVDHLEELLYSADLSVDIVEELLDQVRTKFSGKQVDQADFKAFMHHYLESQLSSIQSRVEDIQFKKREDGDPLVVMIVGVNGAGKTTTIGKLATKLSQAGLKVTVGACDTFRAAAVEQLAVWCERAGAEMIQAKAGNDPSGVGYDALAQARSNGSDVCLLDTAGRLHTNSGLMEELRKSKRVLGKLQESAPDHVLLVVDAISGQNTIQQAKEFNQALGLTGLVLTKCDGSSKAGTAVAMVRELQVPITYIGVGESVEDLERFKTQDYLEALLS